MHCDEADSERAVREILKELLGCDFYRTRMDFLDGLELAGYAEDQKVAFEYRGMRHHEFVPKFHKTLEMYAAQIKLDNWKAEKCAEHGIKLIIVPHKFNSRDKVKLRGFLQKQITFC